MKNSSILIWLASLTIVAILAPISLDIQLVPLTLQTLVLFMAFSLFEPKWSLALAIAYLLLGAIGLPIFGNYSSGWEKLIGPTSGFLWGFVICAFYISSEASKGDFNFLRPCYFSLKLMAFY